jgi:Flp pilus assembly protein TadG
MSAHTRRRRRQRPDAGASVVEFALLAPVLFLILFGIIDYGIWFSDSISARQAIRDGARRGVVENFTGCPAPTTGANADMANLACSIRASMAPIAGTAYVRVSIAPGPDAATGGPWVAGGTLRVCAVTKHDALMPLVPFPSGGVHFTRVDMPIERVTGTPARTTSADALPTGVTWNDGSRCP